LTFARAFFDFLLSLIFFLLFFKSEELRVMASILASWVEYWTKANFFGLEIKILSNVSSIPLSDFSFSNESRRNNKLSPYGLFKKGFKSIFLFIASKNSNSGFVFLLIFISFFDYILILLLTI